MTYNAKQKHLLRQNKNLTSNQLLSKQEMDLPHMRLTFIPTSPQTYFEPRKSYFDPFINNTYHFEGEPFTSNPFHKPSVS